MLRIVYFLILMLCKFTQGSKVLFISLQQASHTNTQQSIVTEMLSRGHDVHIVLGSQFGHKFQNKLIGSGVQIEWFEQKPDREYTGANLDQLFKITVEEFEGQIKKLWWRKILEYTYNTLFGQDNLSAFQKLMAIFPQDCREMFEDKNFIMGLRAQNFDLVIVDYWHFNPCSLLLPHNLSVPFIVQSSILIPPWAIGEPGLPSIVPMVQSSRPHSDQMNFYQRVTNIIDHIYVHNYPAYMDQWHTQMLHTYAPGVKSWNRLLTQAEFYITTRDYMLEWPQPTMPNHLRIFGTTFRDAKPLPNDLRKVMESAKRGVIVLSFGSMGGLLPPEYINKVLSALGQFPHYTVIFAYSGKTTSLQPVPRNIVILPWIPQNDILGQEKTVLFITHGGHNGQTEAIYHGVPMIVMPLFFMEQFHNAHRVEKHKYGRALNFYDFTTKELTNKIADVMTDNVYRQNVKKASAIVQDLGGSHPAKLAADKIEHILKYGGEHLRSRSAMDMPMYQMLMLDVLGFALVIVLSIMLVFLFCMKIICSRYNRKDAGKTKQKVH